MARSLVVGVCAAVLMLGLALPGALDWEQQVALGWEPVGWDGSAEPQVYLRGNFSEFDSRELVVFSVAAHPGNDSVPLGLPRLPEPGQFFASPALIEELRSQRGEGDDPQLLLNRFASATLVGEVGRDALQSPDQMLAYQGLPLAHAERLHASRRIAAGTGFVEELPDAEYSVQSAVKDYFQAQWLAVVAATLMLALLLGALFVESIEFGRLRRTSRERVLAAIGFSPIAMWGMRWVERIAVGAAGVASAVLALHVWSGVATQIDLLGVAAWPQEVRPTWTEVAVAAGSLCGLGLVWMAAVIIGRTLFGATRRSSSFPVAVAVLLLGAAATITVFASELFDGAYRFPLFCAAMVCIGWSISMSMPRLVGRWLDGKGQLLIGGFLRSESELNSRSVALIPVAIVIFAIPVLALGHASTDAAQSPVEERVVTAFEPRRVATSYTGQRELDVETVRNAAELEAALQLRFFQLETPVGNFILAGVDCGALASFPGSEKPSEADCLSSGFVARPAHNEQAREALPGLGAEPERWQGEFSAATVDPNGVVTGTTQGLFVPPSPRDAPGFLVDLLSDFGAFMVVDIERTTTFQPDVLTLHQSFYAIPEAAAIDRLRTSIVTTTGEYYIVNDLATSGVAPNALAEVPRRLPRLAASVGFAIAALTLCIASRRYVSDRASEAARAAAPLGLELTYFRNARAALVISTVLSLLVAVVSGSVVWYQLRQIGGVGTGSSVFSAVGVRLGLAMIAGAVVYQLVVGRGLRGKAS